MIPMFLLTMCLGLVLLGTVVYFSKPAPGFLIAMLGVALYFVILLARSH